MAYFSDILMPHPRPEFWIKTTLCLMTPGGFGCVRRLGATKDESSFLGSDKYPAGLFAQTIC